MTDPFAIFRDRCSAAIAAMILGVLLLLPAASLGLGGRTIVEEAFGQFNIPLPGGGGGGTTNEGTTAPPTTATPQGNTNEVLLRGFVGSTLPTQGGSGGNTNTQVLTGRFRMFENESLLHRFRAEMNLAPIDGTAFHNVTIEETAPHRFDVTQGNGSTVTTPNGSIPPFSSKIMTHIFVDNNNNPVIDNVPMTISVSGQVLTIGGISIDESRITDSGVRDILRIINGQTIYGTIPR